MLNFITWTANPNIYDGFVTVRWYGLMFAIGFLIGYYIVYRIFKHEGAPESWLAPLFFYIVIATVVGARLGHALFYEPYLYFGWIFDPDGWQHFINTTYSYLPLEKRPTHAEIFKIWNGGLASHGGTIGIIIAIFIFSRHITKKSPLWTFDRLAVPIGFVAALIRIGNLMNHEIIGGPTDQPWGFRFITNMDHFLDGRQPIFTEPSHPTQIYEAICYLLVFAICMWLYWRRNAQERPGLILGVFLLGIFISRFFVEFVKNVQEPWEISMRNTIGIDMGQLLSIPFIIAGVWLIVRALRRPRQELEYPNKFAEEKDKKR